MSDNGFYLYAYVVGDIRDHQAIGCKAAVAKRQSIAWSEDRLISHSQVDWSTLQMIDGRMQVRIQCPFCKAWRFDSASQVRYRITCGTFTGQCYKDRLLKTIRRDNRNGHPEHPQVDWSDTSVINVRGQRLTHVGVTCPKCNGKRYAPRSPTASNIKNTGFTGTCTRCAHPRKKQWPKTVRLGPGRRTSAKGYVLLTSDAIGHQDMPLFREVLRISRSKSGVTEHRFVMAKKLGRALKPNELVDHMDGVKTNNNPDNLRIYVCGKNQPGSHHAYGTYYHEWQLALALVRELEARIGIA